MRKIQRSFTLVEILIIMGIFVLLIGASVPALRLFQKTSDLEGASEQIVTALRVARNKTMASEAANQWGVYFFTSALPNKYTLFQGESYSLRVVSLDQTYNLPNSVGITQLNLGGGEEIVFDRLTGKTSDSGSISLGLLASPSEVKNIYITAAGQIEAANSIVPSDEERVKDSRHVHFNYSRQIAILSENIILNFTSAPSNVSQIIPIADNLKDGQIFWEGQVSVDGENQILKIYTHKLNNPDSQFSISRDRRYNTKALEVRISGDLTGNLVRYDISSQTTKGDSIYVSSPEWQ